MNLSNLFSKIIPENIQNHISTQFKKPEIELSSNKSIELPAFDMIRAAVNMMVAAILISIATSFKLPLSTTYVTFMVAMGTSLADRAWGSESAVYRVAGVLNVIGGWFFTAFIAFVGCGAIAFLINLGGPTAIAIFVIHESDVMSLFFCDAASFEEPLKVLTQHEPGRDHFHYHFVMFCRTH